MKLCFPEDFKGQFVLSDAGAPAEPAPGGRVETRSLQLALHPGMAALPVEDSSGRAIGVLLGVPIPLDTGEVVAERLRLPAPCPEDAAGIEDFIETQIYALAGSFLFLLDLPGARRLYLDACGSLSAVYEPASRRVAATSLLLLDPESAARRFRAESYRRLGVIREGWFLGGLTAHEGIFRLMPNFYLDLDRFETRRHWPRTAIAPAGDPAEACAGIAGLCRATIAATAASGGINMALTAGNETRLLLSTVRDRTDALRFFTVDTPDTRLDVHVACALAARHGLNHRLLPEITATAAEQADWHARTGHTFGGPHVRSHPTAQQFCDQPFFVGGLGGEIGRGFFWRRDDHDGMALTAQDIWARTGLPPDAPSLTAVETWLDSVRGLPALLQLDLAYLELRMGCWGFAMAYANHRPVHIHPLINRASFAAMLSLPPDWRRMQNKSNRMIREIIRQGWPDLLELPINRYGDYRDPLRLVGRAIRSPHLVAKKLRKLRA